MDPNAEVKTTKGTRYVNADWSEYSRVKKAGLQEVAVETVVYANGRVKEFILDGSGNRFPDPVKQDYDEDQEKRFKEQQAAAQKEQSSSERKKVSVTYEGSGADRKRRTVYESGPDLVEDAPETAATSPAAQRTAREEAEIAANAALPPDQDPRPETNKERAERAERVIKEQGAAAAAAAQKDDTTVESVVYEGKGKERKKVTTYRSGRKVTEDAATNATATGVTYDPDGTKVTTYDDGTQTREQLSPAQQRAERQATQVDEVRKPVTGKDGKPYTEVTKKDPNTGKTETWHEDEQGQRVSLPGSAMSGVKDVPSFTPDLMQPGAGIVARTKQLDELLAAGKLTWEQRQAILAEDVRAATAVASEFNTATTLLREQYQQGVTQRGQDMTQANVRANLADSHHKSAIGLIEKFAPYLGATAGDAGKLFVGMMASQLATATMYGGMKDSPRVEMDPRLRQFADRKVDAALGTPAPAAPGAVPPGPGEAAAPLTTEQAQAAAVRAAHEASGQPLPPPLLGPEPAVPAAPVAGPSFTDPTTGRFGIPGSMGTGPYAPTPAVTQTDPLATAPAGGNVAAMEALYGKVLPQPTSWREDAEARLFDLRMPKLPGASAVAGLFGSSPVEQYGQPAPGMDFSLPTPGALPPLSLGGDPAIDAEARRQLAAEGIIV